MTRILFLACQHWVSRSVYSMTRLDQLKTMLGDRYVYGNVGDRRVLRLCDSYPSSGNTAWSHLTASGRYDCHIHTVPLRITPEVSITVLAQVDKNCRDIETGTHCTIVGRVHKIRVKEFYKIEINL